MNPKNTKKSQIYENADANIYIGLELFYTRKKNQTIVARMLFTSIRSAARQTTEFEAAEPSQLGGVAVRRLAAECRYTMSNPMQGSMVFHFYCLRLTMLTI